MMEKELGFLLGVLFCTVSASLRTEGVKLRKDLGGPNIDSMSSVTLITGIYLTVPRSIVYPSWLPQWDRLRCKISLYPFPSKKHLLTTVIRKNHLFELIC